MEDAQIVCMLQRLTGLNANSRSMAVMLTCWIRVTFTTDVDSSVRSWRTCRHAMLLRKNSRGITAVPDQPQTGNQVSNRFAANELHGVKVNTAILADRVDRNDVRVVERRSGADFIAKPVQGSLVRD